MLSKELIMSDYGCVRLDWLEGKLSDKDKTLRSARNIMQCPSLLVLTFSSLSDIAS